MNEYCLDLEFLYDDGFPIGMVKLRRDDAGRFHYMATFRNSILVLDPRVTLEEARDNAVLAVEQKFGLFRDAYIRAIDVLYHTTKTINKT